MGKVVQLKRKAKPLTKTYRPSAPYVVERCDEEDGNIFYDVVDERPDSYRVVCSTEDSWGQNPLAKYDADQIARGLNMLVQYGKEQLPKVNLDFEPPDGDDEMED